jgi:hypothetical protein
MGILMVLVSILMMAAGAIVSSPSAYASELEPAFVPALPSVTVHQRLSDLNGSALNIGSTVWNQLDDAAAINTWIDGEALKYLLRPLYPRYGQYLEPLIAQVQGVELVRGPVTLQIHAYFNRTLDVALPGADAHKSFQLYSVHLPHILKIDLNHDGGVIRLTGMDPIRASEDQSVFLEVNVPYFTDRIYLRTVTMDLETGEVYAEAGLLHDYISFWAKAQIFSTPITASVDIWRTIRANLPGVSVPPITFLQL